MKKSFRDVLADHYIIFCVYAFIGWIYEVSWYLIVEHRFVNRGVLFGPFLPIYGFGVLILLLLLRKFMSGKHYSNQMFYSSVSLFTITTFLVTTIIEYTTPKIYRVDYFIEHYGVLLFFINLVVIVGGNWLFKKYKGKKMDFTIVMVFLFIWIITTLIEYVSHYMIDIYGHKMLWDYSYDFLNINKRVNWDASRNFAIGGTLLLYTIQPVLDKFLERKSNVKIVICVVLGGCMLVDFVVNVILK